MTTFRSDVKRYAELAGSAHEEKPDGEWVKYEDAEPFIAAAGELRPCLDLLKKRDAEVERLRAVCDQGSQLNADVMRRAQRAEAQLASLNAEVERVTGLARATAEAADKLLAKLAAANALLADKGYILERYAVLKDKLAAANALLEEAKPLWQEWRDTDITEDEDRWAAF